MPVAGRHLHDQAEHVTQPLPLYELSSTGGAGGAARVIAGGGTSYRSLRALENTIASLALKKQPIALEIAGDTHSLSFQIRASTPEATAHLRSQIQALYPQARIDFLPSQDDPLRLEQDEALTVVELAVRGQSYLSLRTLDARSWNSAMRDTVVGDDPLLAVLGAFQRLPDDIRVISQLALVPASPRWTRPYLHTIQESEQRRNWTQPVGKYKNSSRPSMALIMGLALLVVLALLERRFGAYLFPLVPSWFKQDVLDAVQGHLPVLTAPQVTLLVAGAAGVFVFVFLVSRLWVRIEKGGTTPPIYDRQAVSEKAKKAAYRARLRLMVIGKVEPLVLPDIQTKPTFSEMKAWLRYLYRWAWTRLTQRQKRQEIAAQLAAAYRQYENPMGNVLVPRVCHLRHAHVLARSEQDDIQAANLTHQRSVQAHPAVSPSSMLVSAAASSRSYLSVGFQIRRFLSHLLLGRAQWERDIATSPLYLSVEEIAALWHLISDQDAPDIAGLERGLARSRPLPRQLVASHTLLPYRVGECQHAGQHWSVFAPADLFCQNSLLVAATGKGKSTLLSHMALAYFSHTQNGLFFMEPHGDTILALLGSIPPFRHDDVTLIDLADETMVAGLNPLDMTQGRGRDKTVDDILAVFIAFWQKQRSWGPRTENILQFALLALAEANLRRIEDEGDSAAGEQYTLLDVIPLLQQWGFRHLVLDNVRDPVILDWFHHYYDPLRQSYREEIISSIINKISKYAAAKISRRLLGQSRATIRLADDIRAGRAILVNTASGIVGEEVSALVGATLVGLFQAALAEQIRLSQEDRRRFWVVIDEFQTYLGIDYNTMLAELRKYGGSFALATQSLSYLDEVDRSLKPTVLTNSDHLFCFAMEATDAKQLSSYLDGLQATDLVNLDAYHCYARWTVQGQRLPAFSLQIAPPPLWDAHMAALLRQHSNERHSRPVVLVDEEVAPLSTSQPLQPSLPTRDSTAWPDDGFVVEAVEVEAAGGTADTGMEIQESAKQLAPARRRGGGGGGGKRAKTGAAIEKRESLSRPYALENPEGGTGTQTARVRGRAVWVPESAHDESGELRGE